MKSFHDGKVTLHNGDCVEVLKAVPENSIDAVVTDPPYHLTSIVKWFGGANATPAKGNEAFIRASRGFMGKVWDGGDIAFTVELWAEVLRVLKPGGHMVCFGGTRTCHRMVCAIEDAGFEIRDQLAWVYSRGFPKSHNISRNLDEVRCGCRSSEPQKRGAWPYCDWCGKPVIPDGLGTALKPAHEPICLARKPLSESTVAANVLRWGTGALNIDATRVGTGEIRETSTGGMAHKANPIYGRFNDERKPTATTTMLGRWPANLCHDGSPEVLAGFPETSSTRSEVTSKPGQVYRMGNGLPSHTGVYGFHDSGSAARLFYTAKADWDDRLNSKHPTVKPVDLMQWLVRLVCPKGATVLDPFAGTGTTGAASFIEGRRCVLIEREAEYLADIEKRMDMLLSGSEERSWKLAKPEPLEALPLFALTGD